MKSLIDEVPPFKLGSAWFLFFELSPAAAL